MHVSTTVRRSTALIAVLVAAAACSDAMTAPAAMERPHLSDNALQLARGDNKSNDASTASTDNGETTLTVDPRVARSYDFGENSIYFPAHSICDPATSGYGPTLWDMPCQPLRERITISVKWSGRGGHGFVRFEPDLRFVPAKAREKSRWVILSMHDKKLLKSDADYRMLYQVENKVFIDESLTDRTLLAWTDKHKNTVLRRIKHFSGYMLAAGLADFDGGFYDAY